MRCKCVDFVVRLGWNCNHWNWY